ncbi:MAG: MBL fold metallo-hydrolase RNA specificity domain-containing protein, partial [Mycobacterium sp.]
MRADVVSVGLSAHADQDELVGWAKTASPPPLENFESTPIV